MILLTGTLPAGYEAVLLIPEPTFEAIESAGRRVTKHAEARVLAVFFFISSEIERVMSYEAGFVGHHTVREPTHTQKGKYNDGFWE